MLRKCGLFALSLAVLSTSFSVLFSDVSNAASIYDSSFNDTTQALVGGTNGSKTCDYIDISQNFSEYIRDDEKWAFSGSSAFREEQQSSWEISQVSGRWGVSQYETQVSGQVIKLVDIFWTEDDSLQLYWSANNVQSNRTHVVTVGFGINAWEGCDLKTFNFSFERFAFSTKNTNLADGEVLKNLFVYVDEDKLNLPLGYEGIIPRNSLEDNRELIAPHISGMVSDKSFSVVDDNKKLPPFPVPDEGYTFTGFKMEWSLFQCVKSEHSDSTCLEPNLVNIQYLNQAERYLFDVNEYGSYMLEAQYLVEQCYRYPSYPATPDYCFYVDLNTEFEDYRFLPRSKSFEVDGSTIIFDTSREDCDESGFCQPKPQDGLYDYFKDRENFGLTAILLSPVLFYQQLPSMANNCQPITFPLFGQTIALECLEPRYQAWSPFILGVYTSVINAIVVYAVALGVFRTMKNVNNPEDDRIEVKSL